MMKKFSVLFFCLFTLFSCSPKDKVPKSLIQPEKMGDVLWDVMRMQFLAEEKASSDTTINKDEKLIELTEKVFKIHKTTSKKFDESYNWYVKHPTLLKRIFDSMQVQKQRLHDGNEELLDETLEPSQDEGKKLERRNRRMNNVVE